MRGSAPAYLSDLMFDSLLTGSLDETGAGYGLLAEDVVAAPDGLSVTFRLRREARFHNGDPVLAADVKHSFDTLMGPHTSPAYKTILEDVAGLDVVDERTVRYRFKKPNRELPLTVGASAGVQPRLGRRDRRQDRSAQDLRPGGDGHSHRQRPLQDWPGALRQGHHLRARPRLLGARPACAARHSQFRPHHGQDLQGQHRAAGGAEGWRVRPDAFLFGGRLGAPRQRQAL